MINNVSIGADPEVFLFDEDYDEYIPAIDLLGGTKANPKSVGKDTFVQEDNVMAEFNIPPCTDEDQFVKTIVYAMEQIETIVPDSLQIATVPSAIFKPNYLEDPQACISGCDPYQNAWKDGEIEEAVSLEDTNNRSAGGHIHIGYTKPDEDLSMRLVRNLDLFLGVPSVLKDADEKRRETYGKAGSFRNKDYGVEYRSLSNFWLKNDSLMRWVFRNTMKAVKFTRNGKDAPTETESIINDSDKDKARDLIEDYGIAI